jgi:hypothetical protein
MVSVRVRDDYAVQSIHLGSEQLLAQVRAAVDKHAFPGTFDED